MAEGPEERSEESTFVRDTTAFEVVVEHIAADHTAQVTEYQDDLDDNPMHPDTTIQGEPYGISTRPPVGVEQLAVESKAGTDWILTANADRPNVTNEGGAIFYEMYQSGGSWVVGGTVEIDGGDVYLKPRSGKEVITNAGTRLGSPSAAEPMLFGFTVASDLNTFLASWITALTTLSTNTLDAATQVYADQLRLTDIPALQTAIASWRSTKHFLDA